MVEHINTLIITDSARFFFCKKKCDRLLNKAPWIAHTKFSYRNMVWFISYFISESISTEHFVLYVRWIKDRQGSCLYDIFRNKRLEWKFEKRVIFPTLSLFIRKWLSMGGYIISNLRHTKWHQVQQNLVEGNRLYFQDCIHRCLKSINTLLYGVCHELLINSDLVTQRYCYSSNKDGIV